VKSEGPRKLFDSSKNTPYYNFYFYKKPHENYFAKLSNTPMLVSIEIVDKNVLKQHEQHGTSVILRALVKTKWGEDWVFVPYSPKKKSQRSSSS